MDITIIFCCTSAGYVLDCSWKSGPSYVVHEPPGVWPTISWVSKKAVSNSSVSMLDVIPHYKHICTGHKKLEARFPLFYSLLSNIYQLPLHFKGTNFSYIRQRLQFVSFLCFTTAASHVFLISSSSSSLRCPCIRSNTTGTQFCKGYKTGHALPSTR